MGKVEIVTIAPRKDFTCKEAIEIGDTLGLDWDIISQHEFFMGVNVELEHGRINALTNITNDDPILTGKIALIHIIELDDYYTRLKQMEKQGEEA